MQNLNQINLEISKATQAAQRSGNDITLVAVSKTQNTDTIIKIHNAGQMHFGENYVSEAVAKIKELEDFKLTWHYLGAIQSNKLKDIVTYFDYVHSVDSLKHAEALAKACQAQNKMMPIFLQVNLEHEPSKSGFSREELERDLVKLSKLPQLKILGLMLIPSPKPKAEQQKVFAQLRVYRNNLEKKFNIALPELSMGMSEDFIEAILEGATYIRIGTKIFGARS